MRILFVGNRECIHVCRWITGLARLNWDIHLFHCYETDGPPPRSGAHQRVARLGLELKKVTIHGFDDDPTVALTNRLTNRLTNHLNNAERLAALIDQLKPNAVHSIPITSSGWLTWQARKKLKAFPPWIAGSLGNDMNLYRHLGAESKQVAAVLKSASHLWIECRRDVGLAREFGFTGKILDPIFQTGPVFPAKCRRHWQGKTSERKWIFLKGYHDYRSRALVGLRALERVKNLLRGFRIGIYRPSPEVIAAIPGFFVRTAVPVEVLPEVGHEQHLWRLGGARVSLGLALSDGVVRAVIDAMAMGAIPIQAETACTRDWVDVNRTAFFVHPEDPISVARALKKALGDDRLVDAMAERAFAEVSRKMNQAEIFRQVKAGYAHVEAP